LESRCSTMRLWWPEDTVAWWVQLAIAKHTISAWTPGEICHPWICVDRPFILRRSNTTR
uniref:Transposase n=1 Tax=Gongylonema pulchrum TaxID=637853 RepID=A0A183DJL8_9BILA